MTHQIGTLAEKSLHASLKEWYAQPGDQFEVEVDGYIIDIVRGDLLIEIQTRHFASIAAKLAFLVENYPLHLVHPIAEEKWIVRQSSAGNFVGRRRSPKRGRIIDVFNELVSIPDLVLHPNLGIIVLLIQEDQVWRDDGRGSWRRKYWSIHDRRLLKVVGQHTLQSKAHLLEILPSSLADPFTNRQLAEALDCSPRLASKITYTLRKAGCLLITDKIRKAFRFARNP